MNPTKQLIPVQCQSCGAQLHIDPDGDQVQCPFCGATYLIRRDGNTVALKTLTRSLGQIVNSTEATALELAIVRLSREIDEREEQKKANASNQPLGCFLVCIIVTILGIILEARKEPICCGLTIIAAIMGTFLFIALLAAHREERRLDQEIQELRKEIEAKRARL